MNKLELIGQVDEQHRLTVVLPDTVSPGPVRITLEFVPGHEDSEGDSWAAAIAQIWEPDWSDPREDIYTLEDGVPVNEPR